jgi:hypothetical protein
MLVELVICVWKRRGRRRRLRVGSSGARRGRVIVVNFDEMRGGCFLALLLLKSVIRSLLLSHPVIIYLLTKVLTQESSGGIATIGKHDLTAIVASDFP